MSTYQSRTAVRTPDGGRMLANADDARNERFVASRLERAWNCEARKYPPLNPIDYYLEKNDRLVGYAEIKMRTHPSTKYPTVLINTRKYQHLLSMYMFTGSPAYYVVGFSDGRIGWIEVQDIVPSPVVRVISAPRAANVTTDREPVFEIPIAGLTFFDGLDDAA